MDKQTALDAFAALSQQTRLDVFQLLVCHEPHGLAAGEIAERLGVPANTLSTHLGILTRAGLTLSERRSRSIIYRAALGQVSRLASYLTQDCCAGHPERCGLPSPSVNPVAPEPTMTDRVYNVLFLCTGNSARSILAEAILRHEGGARFRVFSAGSHPTGVVNPLAVEVLAADGYATEGLRSKSWDEFSGPDAPVMDFVFTVCDQAAGEACPAWIGHPVTAHWGIVDPAATTGPALVRKAAFVAAARYLKNRINAFLALPLGSLERLALTEHLSEIGRSEGASTLEKAQP